MLHVRVIKLAIVLSCLLYLPIAEAGQQRGTEWEVTSGDTLYQIGRTIYPGNPGKQSLLRQDIMMLNPDVFKKNINMEVGVVLKLPRYVVDPEAAEPVRKQPQSAPKIETAKPAPVASSPTAIGGNQWVVKRGDTLYAISRSIYPGDAGRQKQLRQDIIELNPQIFASGANNLAVGVILQLPDFGDSKTAQPGLVDPVKPLAPVAVEPASKPAAEAVTPVVAVEPAPKPAAEAVEPVADAKPEPTIEPAAPTTTHRIDSGFLASLGLAYGGDKLVSVDNGVDIRGGSGVNLRLGYQQLRDDGHGYRVALGYQYHWVEDASLKSPYLQAAYQYRQEPVLYGIGVVAHTGAELEDDDMDVDYDPAVGLLLYVENVGNGNLAGWGLSYTALDFDDKDSSDSVDASRAEIYYNWHF